MGSVHKAVMILAVTAVLGGSSARSPEELAVKVADQLLKNPGAFIAWDYGGALVFDGIHQISQVFHLPNYTEILDKYLDQYLSDPTQYGYKLLHHQKIEFGKAVGDTIGLFPIAYLNRVVAKSGQPGYDNATDLFIAKTVAQQFIEGWPHRLPDGTFSREEGWAGETAEGYSFLWGDDQYMGLTLLARLGVVLHDVNMVKYAAQQAIQLARYMQNPADSLFFHGYNNADRHTSCCYWGRANGWGVMAHVEVYLAVITFPELMDTPVYGEIRQLMVSHILAVIFRQTDDDGRWHQVLNETSTFLETSCSAMFLVSLIRPLLHTETLQSLQPELPAAVLDPAVMSAWRGLQKAINDDGTISGVCMAQGIVTSVAEYNQCVTLYILSRHGGVGAVASALAYIQRYLDSRAVN